MTQKKKGKKVVCHKCDYSWAYTGALRTVTCPCCGIKTTVRDKKV